MRARERNVRGKRQMVQVVEEEGVVGEVAGGEGLLILGRHCSLW